MNWLALSMNHRNTPLELREQFALPEERLRFFLKKLKQENTARELCLLSTCNRVELYTLLENPAQLKALQQELAGLYQIPQTLLENHTDIFWDESAIRHGFQVAAGLHSMVLGEPQILGQMRDAYQIALEEKTTATFLNKYFQQALSVGKKVRAETGLSQYSMSVSSISVKLAKRIFSDFKYCQVLLMGAGKMAELTARYLREQGVPGLFIANRDLEKAQTMAARFQAQAVYLKDVPLLLHEVDMVIASTAASHYLLDVAQVTKAMHLRKNRPIFLIDIAVPRNIDPKIADIYNVYLYDIDDLQSVVEDHQKARQAEAQKAEVLIEKEVEGFLKNLRVHTSLPPFQMLSEKFHTIRRQELQKAFNSLKNPSPETQKILEDCTFSIINKILRDPLLVLKQELQQEDNPLISLELLKKLFRLDVSSENLEDPTQNTSSYPKAL